MMKLAKETTEGSIVQPQARFSPPRYPGDLALIYLKNRYESFRLFIIDN